MTVVQTSPFAHRHRLPHLHVPDPSPLGITLVVVVAGALTLGVLFFLAIRADTTASAPASGTTTVDTGIRLPTLPDMADVTAPPAETETVDAGESAPDYSVPIPATRRQTTQTAPPATPAASSSRASATTRPADSSRAGTPAEAAGAARGSLTAVDSSDGAGAFYDLTAPSGTFTPGAELTVRLDGRTMTVMNADGAGGAMSVLGWVDDPNPPAPGPHTVELRETGGNSVTTTITIPAPPG